MPKKQNRTIDKIMVKSTLEYIFAKNMMTRYAEEFLKPYMGFRSGSVKAAVTRICPEMEEQYNDWILKRSKNFNRNINADKTPVINEDKYLQALQKSGIYFEDRTMKDICTLS